ncbi:MULTISPECIES: GtrA family protein [unclassified Mesorhizobium]|uniref:GtrA family protein n=1 Tax=unclassified Mesorhizobium TaxID=325217 RepID=UPI000FCBC36A|nr:MULTISPECIES: GtrA family protein [unclassified Mesorhizobium]TGV09033.1 GtrA family protein [Mesorhizobium sp. M8A.F.Ca.ET.173.01.1.1]TGV51085.1 GtrA family protein [bacterium M00.F.Ca.ET.141.01.1.1]TIS93769.1 MAG: GtrA family protein [Mesorhizobium sp.]RUW52181.1 GtrA family protein [Mesorhizobium sp. M8A.F.Ca.ET.021.01.1.1]TGQ02219.1 GtrA family protein [Mesorhizobium sp. M8A.F.Ca.ET.218.01.1.1]
MQRIVRFVFAGGIGFVADAAALWLLLAVTPLGPFVARMLSIGFALFVTWQINRHLTFSPSSRGVTQEGARYGGVGVATSIVNYAVYSAILLVLPAAPPLAALAIASLVAMTLSFLGYSRLVFDR